MTLRVPQASEDASEDAPAGAPRALVPTRRVPSRIARLWVPIGALALLLGCGVSDATRARTDAGAGGADGGAPPSPADGAIETPSEPEPLPLDESNYADSGEIRDDGSRDLSACYDAPLATGPESDCVDPRCSLLPSCCPGRAACCDAFEVGPGFDEAELEGCLDPASCLGAARLFGAPSPFLVGSALAMGGDTQYDSGVLFERAYDLRHERLDVEARFELPVDCDACFESAAIGVTTQATLGSADHVSPLAALVLSGARDEVRLVISGTVVASWDASEGPWALELAPTGTLSVREAGETRLRDARFSPAAEARVVLYGHSRNPGATDSEGARITSLTTRAARCDMPSAWSAPTTLRFERGPDTWQAFDPRSPTLALDASGVPTMVFVDDGSLYAAKAPDPASRERFVPRAPGGFDDEPLLAGDPSNVYASPSLTRRAGDPGFWLYTLRHGPTGTALIRVAVDDDALTATGDVETVALAGGEPLVGAAALWSSEVGRFILVTTRADGTVEAWASPSGVYFERWSVLPREGLHVDQRDVPRLSIEGSTYRTHLGVRRGTRWQSALFVSDDLVHWRLIDDESVQPADQVERIGTRAVASLRDADRELIVYEALDGVLTRLRTRSRPLPAH